MSQLQLADLPRIRRTLGKSQRELAALLGLSTRALQSYEQGWRPTPPHVQRATALLLFLDWRKAHGKRAPCWELCRCLPEARALCPAHQLQAGDLCWLLNTARCRGRKVASWERKIAQCQKCPVMRPWLRPS